MSQLKIDEYDIVDYTGKSINQWEKYFEENDFFPPKKFTFNLLNLHYFKRVGKTKNDCGINALQMLHVITEKQALECRNYIDYKLKNGLQDGVTKGDICYALSLYGNEKYDKKYSVTRIGLNLKQAGDYCSENLGTDEAFIILIPGHVTILAKSPNSGKICFVDAQKVNGKIVCPLNEQNEYDINERIDVYALSCVNPYKYVPKNDPAMDDITKSMENFNLYNINDDEL